MINYGKQLIEEEEIQALIKVCKSDWLTQGPKIKEFEEAFSKYCGSKYTVAVSSGTAALHLANIVLGTTKGSKVVTSPITFLASANSIIYSNGNPVFSDINSKTFTLDPNELKKIISKDSSFKGIIPVHLGGVICDMESLKEIADEYNLWIIEDACHAIGGQWVDKKGVNQKVGNCSYSDLTTFSFHPVKHITTGEGGAITTNDKALYEKLILLRSHGMIKNPEQLDSNQGSWYYEMHELGYNYRLTDFQAALGIEQLRKSDGWVKKRRELVMKYDLAFKKTRNLKYQKHPDLNHLFSYHLYIIQCENRKELYDYLKQNGVNTQVHYIPVHLQPYYKNKYGYKKGDFPVAEKYYEKALSLPLYPSLRGSEQEKVIDLVQEFYEKN
jgi:UDP-4-amino-4,6-dideoxy-N-acetyl-beta-L-altrosamine transaminase